MPLPWILLKCAMQVAVALSHPSLTLIPLMGMSWKESTPCNIIHEMCPMHWVTGHYFPHIIYDKSHRNRQKNKHIYNIMFRTLCNAQWSTTLLFSYLYVQLIFVYMTTKFRKSVPEVRCSNFLEDKLYL